MKAIGGMEWLKAKEISYMQMVTFTPASFTKIELMDMEFTSTKMVNSTKAIGEMTCSMARERNNSLTAVLTKAISNLARSMVKVSTNGLTGQLIQAIGSKIELKAKESINGPMAVSTMAHGPKINCMAKGSTLGLTVEDMRVTTSMRRNMDTVPISGPMANPTKDSG